MAKTLILICHLERLGPSYVEGDAWVDYWLGLNCGYEDGTPTQADAERLRTWLWSGFKGIVVAGLDGSDIPVTLDPGDVKVLPVPNGWVNPTQKFLDRLQKTFEDSKDVGLESFALDAKPQLGRKNLPWTAFLGATSAWPGGLNDWIHTSIRFRIKKTSNDNYQKLIATPVFDGPVPFQGGRAPVKLTGLKLSDPNSPIQRNSSGMPVLYEWVYEDGDIPLKSRQAEGLTSLDPGKDPTVDMKTLHLPGFSLPDASADWAEDLDVALAELFDLPRLLLGVVKRRLKAGTWAPDVDFHDLFIASLRDIANLGRSAGADGSRLSQWLLDRIGLSGEDSKLAALDKPDLDAWRTQLAKALLDVQKTDSFKDEDLRVMKDGKRYLAALEQIHDRLSRQETVTAAMLPQWKIAFGLEAAAQAPVLKTLKESMELAQLRKRMLLGSMGPAWRSLRFKNVSEFEKQVVASVEEYVKQRSDSAGADGYRSFYPRIPKQPADIAQVAKEAGVIAGELVKERVLPRPYDGEAPDARAEGLLIPIGPFRSAPTAAADDREDSHRRIGGAGIFLKADNNTDPWTMLNYARIVDEDGTPLITKPVPIPLKLQYRNGVANAHQLYLNQALAAEAADQEEYSFEETGKDVPSAFKLENPYGIQNGQPKLAGLVYGGWYRTWIHHFGKGANLPEDLTARASDTNLPWQLVEPAKDAFQGEFKTLQFVRRTTLGGLRLCKAGAKRQDLKVPAIPKEIHTLRDSLFQGESTVVAGRKSEPKASIILLAPNDTLTWSDSAPKDFSFDVYPPAVDRDIWHRWIGYDASTLDFRQYVREQWLAANGKAEKGDGKPFAIDDPGAYALELVTERQFGTNAAPAVKAYILPFPARPKFDVNAKSPDSVQGAPWVFKIVTSSSSSTMVPVIDQAKFTVTLPVPEGELWSFRLRPRAKAGEKDRFHKNLWPFVGEDQPDHAYMAHGEVHLMVEVATTWAEKDLEDTQTALHLALNSKFEPKTQKLVTKFTPSGLPARLVCRVDLQVQRWRWDGRPVYQTKDKQTHYGYPFDSEPSTQDAYPLDGALFGGRDSSDRYELTKSVDFVCTPPDSGTLEERDLSTMPGALYYRFALRVYSRYAPWLRRNASLDTLSTKAKDKSLERWRRTIVPCRYRGKLPRPALRLILPLTVSGEAQNPNLLLLLDDQWYRDELAGLAERLEGEIVRVRLPDSATQQASQFGPDPVVQNIDDPYVGADITLPPAIGAIGYTFDTDTQAPLFRKTSFVQPAPQIAIEDKEQQVDLSWHFVQLRYRRMLDEAGIEDGLKGGSNVSDWTEPVWVQILPPADRFRVQEGSSIERKPVSDLIYDAGAGKVHVRSNPASEILPTKSTSNDKEKPAFTLFALLTRAATDAFGRKDSESYVEFQPLVGLKPYPEERRPGLRVRLVELQHRRDEPISGDKVFEALFPQSNVGQPSFLEDQRARVVRVSPPILAV